MHDNILARFLGIPNHKPGSIYFLDERGNSTAIDDKVETVVIELFRISGQYMCPCGKLLDNYYDYTERFIRDLSWGPWNKVELLVPRFRVNCSDCGVKTEPLDWIVRNCTYTKRFADAVSLACTEIRSISAISESFNISWHTVKEIDSRRLNAELNPPDFSGLKLLGIDEFAIRKGHEYATVFVDLKRSKVVWICKGRDKAAVCDVFKNVFGKSVCDKIKAVAMDCWRSYEYAVKEYMKEAEIVFDVFHIIQNYNRDVIDRVRRNTFNDKRKHLQQREFKRYRFLILKNPCSLKNDEPAKLKELFRYNKHICKAYIMRDALKKLWEYKYAACAEKWLTSWSNMAINSKILPLVNFGKRIIKHLHGIVSHCKYPISTASVEGINNKIKVIKRVAYGFRDEEYFFLKIRKHFNRH